MEDIQPTSGLPEIEKPAQEYKVNEFTSVAGYGVGVLTAEKFHERRYEPPSCVRFCSGCGSSGSSQAKKV